MRSMHLRASPLMLPGRAAAAAAAMRRLAPQQPAVVRRTPLSTWRVEAAAADGTGKRGERRRSSPRTADQLDSLLAEKTAAGEDFSWAAAAEQRSDSLRCVHPASVVFSDWSG
jgi:hypothetical protein